MAVLDIIILSVAIGGLIYGFHKGIITQLAAVMAFVLALIAARILGDAVASVVLKMMGGDEASLSVEYSAGIIGNALVFVAVYIGVKLLARSIKTVSRILLMGPIDKGLGAVFTLFEWLVGLSLALNLWGALMPDAEWMEASKLAEGRLLPAVMDLAPWLWGTLTATGAV